MVTQVFLCLQPDQCNVPSVADLVASQVGFPVVLLDSKCYPLSTNSGTSGVDFWKSTRRILAASKSLFEKLGGHGSDVSNAESETQPSSSKKPRTDTLVKILDKVSVIERKVSIPNELNKAMQCSRCQGVASPPVVASCCQRVVACEGCNHTWRASCNRCPLRNSSSAGIKSFNLRGFDDVVQCLDTFIPREEPREPIQHGDQSSIPLAVDTDSSNDFDDLPSFRIPTSQ